MIKPSPTYCQKNTKLVIITRKYSRVFIKHKKIRIRLAKILNC